MTGFDEEAEATIKVLDEVLTERARQNSEWGQQNHPWDGLAPIQDELNWIQVGYGQTLFSHWMAGGWRKSSEDVKRAVDRNAETGDLDYAGILAEEFAEALDAMSIEEVRAELVQVAAVAVAAIESIDRNGR